MSSLAGLAARLMPFQHHPLNKCFGSLSPGAPTPSTGAHCPRSQWLHAVPMFSTCRAAHVQKAVHRLLQLGHGLIAPISAAGRRGLSVSRAQKPLQTCGQASFALKQPRESSKNLALALGSISKNLHKENTRVPPRQAQIYGQPTCHIQLSS